MNDNEFDNLISESLSKYGSEYIDEFDVDYTPHEFSAGFEKKMKKLIKMNKHSAKRPRMTVRHMIAAISAAMLAVSVTAISVGAVRDLFVFNTLDTHTEIEVSKDSAAPDEIYDLYQITDGLDGYELADKNEYFYAVTCSYKNENFEIEFSQWLKEYYNVSVNTENAETCSLEINGSEGFYVDMHNDKYLVWEQDEYIFAIMITSYTDEIFSENALIDMANSVQKVEHE